MKLKEQKFGDCVYGTDGNYNGFVRITNKELVISWCFRRMVIKKLERIWIRLDGNETQRK